MFLPSLENELVFPSGHIPLQLLKNCSVGGRKVGDIIGILVLEEARLGRRGAGWTAGRDKGWSALVRVKQSSGLGLGATSTKGNEIGKRLKQGSEHELRNNCS